MACEPDENADQSRDDVAELRLAISNPMNPHVPALCGTSALTGISRPSLDQTTQQNAALVEESAAAAESLRQQAVRLAEAVAVFSSR